MSERNVKELGLSSYRAPWAVTVDGWLSFAPTHTDSPDSQPAKVHRTEKSFRAFTFHFTQ